MISSSAPKCHRLFVCECEDSFAKDRFRGPYDGPYSEPHVPWPWNSAGYAIYELYKHMFNSYYITAIIFVAIALIAMNMPSSFKLLSVRMRSGRPKLNSAITLFFATTFSLASDSRGAPDDRFFKISPSISSY